MASNRDEGDEQDDVTGVTADYADRIASASRTDRRVLAVVYLYVVAAMVTSSWLVTITGFDSRLQQVGIAAVLGAFWVGYYALSIHPKLVGYVLESDD